MPGVADQIRKTNLKQARKQRLGDMEELVRMVKENRLHEADERQLETLKLVAELQKVFGTDSTPIGMPPEMIELLKSVVREAVGDITIKSSPRIPSEDPDRPSMKHVALDLSQSGEDLVISHGEVLEKGQSSESDSGDKLKKLKKIKGD